MYIYKVAVVGAGTMGAQIAEVVSYAGLPVIVADIQETLARRGGRVCASDLPSPRGQGQDDA